MKKRIVQIIYSIVLVIVFALMLITLSKSQGLNFSSYETHMTSASKNWTVTVGDQKYTGESFGKIDNPNCLPIEMEATVETKTEADSLMYYTIQSESKVWLDNELIYEFDGPDIAGYRVNSPSLYNIVPLPDDAKGKTLRIEINPSIIEASGRIPQVMIGDESELVLSVIRGSITKFVLGIILMIMAVIGLVLAVSVGKKSRRIRKRVMRFMTLILAIAVWCMTESQIKQFVIHNYVVSSYLLELSYFSIPILLSNFYMSFDEVESDRFAKYANLFAKLQFLVVQILLILGVNIVRCNWMMQSSSALVFAAVLYCAYRSEKGSELRSSMKTLTVLVVGAVLEAIRFFFISKTNSGSFILLACVVFVYVTAYEWIVHFEKDFRETLYKEKEAQIELEKANVGLKLAQIRPHFLYNSLMTIQTIIKVDPDYAYDLLGDFSDYLRSVTDSIQAEKMIPFAQELKNIQVYLNIEKMRYNDRLILDFDIQAQDFDVVPLSIQPLAENAVKHGMNGAKPMTLKIKTWEDAEHIYISVDDDGRGFDPNILEDENHRPVGLSNIRYRLQNQMGAQLDIDSAIGEGTHALVTIPKTKKE